MKVMTYNVCVHHASEEGAFGAFSWANRVDAIVAAVQREDPDVVFIQEAPQWRRGDLARALPRLLWRFEAQHSRGGSFADIGVGVRRRFSAPRFIRLDSRLRVPRGEIIMGALWSGHLLALSIHLPTHDEARDGVGQLLDQLIAPLGDHPTIIGGDFNAFPDRGGPRLIEGVCQRCDLVDATANARRVSDSALATSSFLGFPYDVVPPEILAIPGKLDHILTSPSLTTSNPRVLDDLASPFDAHWPSDHAPLTLEVECAIPEK